VITHYIGFRHVELIQDYVDQQQKAKGRHFYVKINDRPVFLKGSNWIPISMFLTQNNTERMEFLLDSMIETGMNTLRVWGGGVYESEEFYQYADSKGILLWQDLMFACALYPTNEDFLKSVETEVHQQIWRIKRHPSILLWAGNNENEIAIRSHWWTVENYTVKQRVSKRFVLSRATMLSNINNSEWFYSSEQLLHRQHKPAGVLTNLLMVFSHFPIPFQCPQSLVDLHHCEYLKSPMFIDRYAFFSQANQATTYKIQTEHYRRYRNLLLPSGLGNTMCALYWQLNDVWAAPTWSTIDFDLNWKMAHYEARRFMAPVIVVMYTSGLNDLGVTVVNDLSSEIEDAAVQIDMFAWTNGFDPIYSEGAAVDIAPLSATEVSISQ
ncbi:hypothetical protein COOONC_12952, partial [Cooperia oncophora]